MSSVAYPHPPYTKLNEDGTIDEDWYNEFLKSKGVIVDDKEGQAEDKNLQT